ncbi:response regulator receiver domain protein [Leptospira ryugenii]|uniref:Response regulator receiver domain protein n=1 Tax=Leptospira ryugenii TaxID=1917863 RepID=A0A2P2E3F7_9LEPT|nr:response regulator [Leptospira ryugenii]GBF51401.1 response regulator receiver domain protein [Leptospira ryugenii]
MKVYQVLLAEDDASNAAIVINFLERYNFLVTHVNNGVSALAKLRGNEFDLFVCDIMMPHMDGLSLLEKAKEYLHHTPTIMLTSAGEKEVILRAVHSGVAAYLLKPVTETTLLEKIFSLLHMTKESLIDKKTLPLQIAFQSNSISEIEMKLSGCPWRKDKGQIYEQFSHFLAGRSTFTELKIIIDSDFFMEGKALPILEDFLGTLAKKTQIRSKNIQIESGVLKRLKPSLKDFECLKDVFII